MGNESGAMNVLERIDEYLQLGGLFNPELANHRAVRDLIIDCRDYIKEQHEINERCNQTIRELRLVNVMEDVLSKRPTVKCKVNEPYVERAAAGEFKWFVYNINSGHIVAATYSEDMAITILEGIGMQTSVYKDLYGICEKWCPPEPKV